MKNCGEHAKRLLREWRWERTKCVRAKIDGQLQNHYFAQGGRRGCRAPVCQVMQARADTYPFPAARLTISFAGAKLHFNAL